MERLTWVKERSWMKSHYRAEEEEIVWTITKEDDNRWYVNRYRGSNHTIYGYPHKTLKGAKERVEDLRG